MRELICYLLGWPNAMRHVKVNNPKFNLGQSLLQAIIEEWDSRPDVSPPDSPTLSSLTSAYLCDLSDLSDLTDLTDLSDGADDSPPAPPPTNAALSTASGSTVLPDYNDGGSSGEDHGEISLTEGEANTPLSRNAKRKARRKERNHAWRKRGREEDIQAIDSHYRARKRPRKKYVETAESIQCEFDIENAAVASTAYVAIDSFRRSKKVYKLSEVTGAGSRLNFRLVEWDGRTPTSIIDKKRRIIGILAGHPNDPRWPVLKEEAIEALETRRHRVQIPKSQRKHRRGAFAALRCASLRFAALRCGVSHGGGQRRPMNLHNDPPNREVLEELNKLKPFRRVAGFSSSVMATWAPALHRYYSDTIDELHGGDPSLHRIFPSGVFSAASYNLGPKTVCYPHQDGGNLAYGSCSLTPFGHFDHKKGGHLILWDLHLVVEFPPGSTILIPSAIIAHSNTAIGDDETRYSFTQYTAGAIFRWVENGCTKRETYLSSLSAEDLANDEKRNKARWKFGLSLFPKAPETSKKARVARVAKRR